METGEIDMFDIFDNINFWSLASFLIRFVGIVVIALYLFPKQIKEVMRPTDGLTGLRWQILGVLGLSVLSALPSVTYQIVRTFGGEAELLRNIASVTSTMSWMLIIVLLVLIFNYKRKGQ